MPIRHQTPSSAGKVGAVQWDEDHTLVGGLPIPVVASPAAGATDTVNLFGMSLAGAVMPATYGPLGTPAPLQESLAFSRRMEMSPYGGGSTATSTAAVGTPTLLGTATGRAIAATNALTRSCRLGQVSAAAVGSMAGCYWAPAVGANVFTIGSGSGLGGFFLSWMFGPSDAAAVGARRSFVGMSSLTTAPVNTEPSTLTNCIGVAKLAASPNLQLVYGGTTAQTPIDLGVNFPAGGLSTDLYQLLMHAPSTSGDVYVQVLRYTTSAAPVADSGTFLLTGTAGVQLPSNSTLLGPRAWACNNTTALSVGLDIGDLYIRTGL